MSAADATVANLLGVVADGAIPATSKIEALNQLAVMAEGQSELYTSILTSFAWVRNAKDGRSQSEDTGYKLLVKVIKAQSTQEELRVAALRTLALCSGPADNKLILIREGYDAFLLDILRRMRLQTMIATLQAMESFVTSDSWNCSACQLHNGTAVVAVLRQFKMNDDKSLKLGILSFLEKAVFTVARSKDKLFDLMDTMGHVFYIDDSDIVVAGLVLMARLMNTSPICCARFMECGLDGVLLELLIDTYPELSRAVTGVLSALAPYVIEDEESTERLYDMVPHMARLVYVDDAETRSMAALALSVVAGKEAMCMLLLRYVDPRSIVGLIVTSDNEAKGNILQLVVNLTQYPDVVKHLEQCSIVEILEQLARDFSGWNEASIILLLRAIQAFSYKMAGREFYVTTTLPQRVANMMIKSENVEFIAEGKRLLQCLAEMEMEDVNFLISIIEQKQRGTSKLWKREQKYTLREYEEIHDELIEKQRDEVTNVTIEKLRKSRNERMMAFIRIKGFVRRWRDRYRATMAAVDRYETIKNVGRADKPGMLRRRTSLIGMNGIKILYKVSTRKDVPMCRWQLLHVSFDAMYEDKELFYAVKVQRWWKVRKRRRMIENVLRIWQSYVWTQERAARYIQHWWAKTIRRVRHNESLALGAVARIVIRFRIMRKRLAALKIQTKARTILARRKCERMRREKQLREANERAEQRRKANEALNMWERHLKYMKMRDGGGRGARGSNACIQAQLALAKLSDDEREVLRNTAVVVIQKWIKGCIRVRRLQLETYEQKDVEAATRIQSWWRITFKDISAYTKIRKHLEEGTIDKALTHIMAGINPNFVFKRGDKLTLLMIAAEAGLEDVCRELLRQGAEADMKDAYGNTALHFAAENARLQVIRMLLACGSSVDIKNKFNSTFLDLIEKKVVKDLVLTFMSGYNPFRKLAKEVEVMKMKRRVLNKNVTSWLHRLYAIRRLSTTTNVKRFRPGGGDRNVSPSFHGDDIPRTKPTLSKAVRMQVMKSDMVKEYKKHEAVEWYDNPVWINAVHGMVLATRASEDAIESGNKFVSSSFSGKFASVKVSVNPVYCKSPSAEVLTSPYNPFAKKMKEMVDSTKGNPPVGHAEPTVSSSPIPVGDPNGSASEGMAAPMSTKTRTLSPIPRQESMASSIGSKQSARSSTSNGDELEMDAGISMFSVRLPPIESSGVPADSDLATPSAVLPKKSKMHPRKSSRRDRPNSSASSATHRLTKPRWDIATLRQQSKEQGPDEMRLLSMLSIPQ